MAKHFFDLREAPPAGSTLLVEYDQSTNLDLAVTTLGKIRIYENRPQEIPRDVRVLVLLDDQFGANVNFDTEHFLLGHLDNNILKHFERYGWQVTLTALKARVDSCSASAEQLGSRSITVDTLLSDIVDVGCYDVLSVMPGSSHSALLHSTRALAMIREAARRGLVVSAWCRGVRVLAAAGVLDHRRIVGHADYRQEYEQAGAIFLGDDHPPVIDGNIVTAVRSRYYRTEACEAIAAAAAVRRAGR